MQKFEYRAPRFLVDLPVVLCLESGNVTGRCGEISNDGMKVRLQEPVVNGSCGSLLVRFRDFGLELRVCVCHSGPQFHGLKFLFESDTDRTAVERLVALVSTPQKPQGIVLAR